VSGPRWEKKEDLAAKAAEAIAKEQSAYRAVLNDVFLKVDDGKGIKEDELKTMIVNKMNRSKKSVDKLSQAAQNKLAKDAQTIVVAMESGFLASAYSFEQNDDGNKVYSQKKSSNAEEEEEEEYDAAMGDEMSDMMEKFNNHANATFTVSDVKAFFKDVDEKKVNQLVKEIENGVYNDMITVTKLPDRETIYVKISGKK